MTPRVLVCVCWCVSARESFECVKMATNRVVSLVLLEESYVPLGISLQMSNREWMDWKQMQFCSSMCFGLTPDEPPSTCWVTVCVVLNTFHVSSTWRTDLICISITAVVIAHKLICIQDMSKYDSLHASSSSKWFSVYVCIHPGPCWVWESGSAMCPANK